MKNYILKVAIIIAVFSILFYSSDSKEFKNFKLKNNIFSLFDINSISNQDIENIGIAHNVNLEKLFLNFDFKATDYKIELLKQAKNINIQDLNSSQQIEILNNCFETINTEKENLIMENLKSQESKNVISDARNLIESCENHEIFKNKIKLLKDNSQSLENKERILVLIFLSTLENSHYFWTSINNGGSGKGSAILNQIEPRGEPGNYAAISNKKKFEKILAADAFGASCAFLGYGIFGALSPIGAGLLFATVGYSAATGSAGAALGI